MSRTSTMRKVLKARFADVYERWTSRQISQAHAANLLGISVRTFQRYVVRYRELGLKGLEDRRATNPRRAPDEEVAALVTLYAERYMGWSIRTFHRAYTDLYEGTRSRSWVQRRLQESGLVTPRRSTRSTPDHGGRQPAEGRLLHQASCTYQWLPKRTWELVALVDDASDRVHSGLFVESETISCRFRTIYETILANGLFDAIHVDPALRNRYDCRETGRFAEAMRELPISVLPSCGPNARSRYRRSFRILREAVRRHRAGAVEVSIPALVSNARGGHGADSGRAREPRGRHGQRCGLSGGAEASIRMRFNHRLWRLHPLVNSGTTIGDPGWRDDPTQNDLLHAIHVVARHVTRQGIPQDATQQSVAIGVVREPQGEGHSTQGPFAPMEQPCDREDASQRQQILGKGDPQTTTSALQAASPHAKVGG